MPTILSPQSDRIGDLVEELAELMAAHIATPPEPPVVHVDAPTINVEAKAPAPVVNLPPHEKRCAWTFTVNRNSDGLIETMTATPKT